MAFKSGIFESDIIGTDPDTGLPLFDRGVDEEWWDRYLSEFTNNGIGGNDPNVLQVTSGEGLSINTNSGSAFINGKYGFDDDIQNIPIDAPDTLNPRIDRVVVRRDDPERDLSLLVIKGTPSSTPEPPPLVRTSAMWDIGLALVTVLPNATQITQNDIVDTRFDPVVCGVATRDKALDEHANKTPADGVHGFNFENDTLTFSSGIQERGIVLAPSGTAPGPVTNVTISTAWPVPAGFSPNTMGIWWTDPSDDRWVRTRVVRKLAAAPQNDTDGTIICETTTRNKYSGSPSPTLSNVLLDPVPRPGGMYYYRFFTYNKTGVVNSGTTATSGFPVSAEKKTWAGTVKVTPATVNVPAYVEVAFTGAMFTEPPIVCVTANSQVIGTNLLGVSVSNITATGCRVYVTRTNIVESTINVIAMEAGANGL